MQTENFFGIHAVKAILESDGNRVIQLFLAEGKANPRIKELTAIARKYGLPIVTVSSSKLDLMVTGNHQGVVAELSLIHI